MNFRKAYSNKIVVVKFLSATILFNTLIAVFLTAIGFGDEFWINFVISQSIGLSICIFVTIAHLSFDKSGPALKAVLMALAMTVGTLCGSYLGSFLAGISPAVLFEKHSLLQLLLLGVMFGAIITYFFSSREQLADSRARIQEEKIKRLTSEKKAAEVHLKLLQAQIEPHFLFNTLSNVLSLLDTDAQKGKSMLLDFIHYLRLSLTKIRGDTTTLGQEMEMIRAYLNLFKVRMGERLRYRIEIPPSMAEMSIAPMLLQPLVENAVKHGLEPKIEGGEISIFGEDRNGVIRLEVIDTGLGLRQERHAGMGLANIRERLEALYGTRSRLILEPNQPCGLKAVIEVPHERT